MSGPEVSHGRGGAGNITQDDTKYADAEIVREGETGTGVSTGRGGAANILEKNAVGPRTDKDFVPDVAMRPSTDDQDHHVGRGGAGNEHLAPGHEHHHHHGKKKEGETSTPTGLADKLKAKIVGAFKK
ncbi:hypothetical protein VP1G_01415 [Cytospora mali]|uniref:Uncharacterized protein n=1 Tax=Cytospora mali TaxID=578113 RepID=A0A194UQN2_CYTMA|nr:hypothetical protein VP1G_01415 [Valsa mali var. pyri (nom. inval.)]